MTIALEKTRISNPGQLAAQTAQKFMSKVVVCPDCGTPVGDAQSGCLNCRAELAETWPPAVLAEPPKADLPSVKLLTGRVWLDEMLGAGLFGLWLFGMRMASRQIAGSYFAYVVRLPLSQEPMPYYVPWVGLGVLALAVLGGTYAGLYYSFPKMGRSFGQFALLGVGMIFVVLLVIVFPQV